LLLRKKIVFRELTGLFISGVRLMAPSIFVLLFAWTLGDLLREDLKTGHHLAMLLSDTISPALLPFMFFVVSALTSFAIGSSWGTMAVMFPIAVQMVVVLLHVPLPADITQTSLLFPVLGAILSGGVLGDHISPISDTTIMSSTSTGSHHIDHVQTQLIYALPIMLATGISFLLAGFLAGPSLIMAALFPLVVGLFASFGLLYLFNKRSS